MRTPDGIDAAILRRAIERGVREGVLTQAQAAPVLERLDRTREANVDLVVLGSWLGVPPETLLGLVQPSTAGQASLSTGLFPEGVRDIAADILAGGRTDPSVPAPTQRLSAGMDAVPTAADTSTKVPAPAPEEKRATKILPRPNLPRRLGPYELLDELGHGGMGVVYRSRHERLGTLCALKVLIAGEHASPEEIARFQLEAAAVARMGKHPNIVSVHDLANEGNLTYYVMELVEGKPLAKLLEERDFSQQETAKLMEKVARALHFAHLNKIVHRDLKPHNVVVRSDGEPQVMDFGLARDVSVKDRMSVQGQMMGSPNYMAPEQARGDIDAIDARTDVYGLGGILYQMLSGFPPHPGHSLGDILSHILRGDIVPPRRVRPGVARDLETICMKCLELDPGKRYATAEALAEDLARFDRGEPVRARPVGRAERAWRCVRRRPLVSGLGAGMALLALVLAWRFLGPAELRVKTDPSHAQVRIIGGRLWGGRWLWPAGQVSIEVSAAGYERRSVDLQVPPGTLGNTTTVELESNIGFLTVDSDPPGAEIWLGNESTHAVTPQTRLAVLKGDHLLRLRLEEHDEYVAPIAIRNLRELSVERKTLAHQKGTLQVRGTPLGATVVVSRKSDPERELTRFSVPVEASLDTGEYVLEGRAPDCFTRRREVVICAQATTSINLSLGTQLLWKRALAGVRQVLASLADVNGDGVLDCLAAASDGRVYALSGEDGASLWTSPSLGEGIFAVDLSDADADGVVDVMAMSRGRVSAVSGRDGSIAWSASATDAWGSPVSADVDGDGSSEYLVSTTKGDIEALSPRDAGKPWTCRCEGKSPQILGAEDLDSDGCSDVLIGSSGANELVILAISGRTRTALWRRSIAQKQLSGQVMFGRMNRDKAPDCLLPMQDSAIALSGRDGSELWCSTFGQGDTRGGCLGDLDGDGSLDCLLPSQGLLHLLSCQDGAEKWSAGDTGIGSFTMPSLADLDGDGGLDCVASAAASSHGTVRAVRGRDGTAFWSFPLPWIASTPPVLGDIDGDGILDCIATQGDGAIFAMRCWDAQLRWGMETDSAWGGAFALHGGDLNGDGVTDCVVIEPSGGTTLVSGKNGDAIFEIREGGPWSVCPDLCDLDRDGSVDLLMCSQQGGVQVMSVRDRRRIWEAKASPPLAGFQSWKQDFDRDGIPDAIASTRDGRTYLVSGRTGGTVWKSEKPAGYSDVVELNGDGIPDVFESTGEGTLQAVSGADGRVLWSVTPGYGIPVRSEPADLDGDGVPDCVTVTSDGNVQAVAGANGSILWRQSVGSYQTITRALADLDGDHVADAITTGPGKAIALSGSNGAILWKRAVPTNALFAPMLADTDGDGAAECLVGTNGGLYALSGRDGMPLWRLGGKAIVWGRPEFIDIDGDGRRECFTTLDNRGFCVLPVPGPRRNEEWQQGRQTHMSQLALLSLRRRDEDWRRLEEESARLAGSATDGWTRAVAELHLGIARTRREKLKEGLEGFSRARQLGLHPPDGAVYEWIAAHAWQQCPPGRREEADRILQGALSEDPDTVLDAFIDTRAGMLLFTDDLRALLERMSQDPKSRVVATVLLTQALPDGKRPLLPEGGAEARLLHAQEDVAGRLKESRLSPARAFGYQALLADALGNREAFSRAQAIYADEPRRPASLDLLLGEAAARPTAAIELARSGSRYYMRKDMQQALQSFEAARVAMPREEAYRFACAQAGHYVAWMLATGKPYADDCPVPAPPRDPERAVTLAQRGVDVMRSLLAPPSDGPSVEGEAAVGTVRPPETLKTYEEWLARCLDSLAVSLAERRHVGDLESAIAAEEEALRSGPSEQDAALMRERLETLRKVSRDRR